MVDYIKYLPSELQSKILDEIPQFTRLSKTIVAGKIHLESLHSKSITRHELNKYLNTSNVIRYFCYYKDDNNFTILEKSYQYVGYQTIYHDFFHHNNINSMHVTKNANKDYPIHMLKYDIYTVYNIYKLLRKEYVNLDKVIFNYFKENLGNFKLNNIFMDKIIKTNYIYSNRLNIDDSRTLSILTVRLSHMLKKNNNMIKYEKDNNYKNKIKTIDTYINNLK